MDAATSCDIVAQARERGSLVHFPSFQAFSRALPRDDGMHAMDEMPAGRVDAT